MTMYANSVVESLDIFEYQFVSIMIIGDLESVQPFPFDKGMEGLDTGIIIWITLMAVAELELLSCLAVSRGNVLASTV